MRPLEPVEKGLTTAEEQKALYAEQVKQLYHNAGMGVLASVINSLILIVIQRNVVSRPTLISWFASLIVISLLRYGDIRAFRQMSPEISDAGRWGRRFIAALALSGMAWGSSAIFLFPNESLAHQTFLAFVIGGMVAGAAATFSSVMKAFLVYSTPALGALILRFVLVGDELHLAMGGMVLLFGIMMFFVAKRINTVRTTSVMLRFKNSDLDLIVEERTAELTRAYERLRAETEELQQAEARLRQAHKMEAVGTLAGGIAHDFNNILSAIIGFSEIARGKTPEGSPVRLHLERIFSAGIRGRDLIKQILAFSRQGEQKKVPVKLAAVVRETIKLLRASLPSTIDIEVNIGNEEGLVLADPTQMQQVVMNLCTNAAHAMRQTGGSISVDLSDFSFASVKDAPESTMNPGSYARLSVQDTGVGMSPETIEHVFDPFFTTKAPGEGTGLGLSVVHGIVASHGGAITVRSEQGKGSTFTVYLPKVNREQSGGFTDERELIPRGHERILFVDDEEDLATMADEMLTGLGYHVTFRTGAGEALHLFKLNPSRFDIVITDQTMPEMTGIELAKELLAVRGDIPIIICTGFSHTVDAETAKTAGVRAFAIKPLTRLELAKTIRKVLDEQD